MMSDQFIEGMKTRGNVLAVEISERNRDELANTYDRMLKKSGRKETR